MTATGFGAILAVVGALLVLLAPSLGRSQADFLCGFFQLNLRERGRRLIKWSYLGPGAGLLLLGVVLIALAQAGVIDDTHFLGSWDRGHDGLFTAVVATFMVGIFVVTLVLMVRLWRRGWPR
jgi:drug/metabolite transporter (DMT)-like permease